jgi:hypothetical protein
MSSQEKDLTLYARQATILGPGRLDSKPVLGPQGASADLLLPVPATEGTHLMRARDHTDMSTRV